MATKPTTPSLQNRIASAALLGIISAVAIVKAWALPLGTLTQMGPGFFPLLLGVLLAVLAVVILVTPIDDEGAPDMEGGTLALATNIRAWALIIGAVVAFMVLGKTGGLVPATFASIFIAALADRGNSLRTALALACGMTLLGVVIFHYLLAIQFPLFRWDF